jgi:UDP-glucuronate 4-epimerase
MNYLVTGGAGFIGSHVCERLLRAGHAVTVLDDLNPFYDPALKRRNLEALQRAALRPTGSSDFAPAPNLNPALNLNLNPKTKAAEVGQNARPTFRPTFEFVHADLTDTAAVLELFTRGRFDQVIHLAARAGVRPSLAEPALYQRVNVEGTVNLLEAARLTGVRKLVIASSSSVYGVNAKVPFAEADPIFQAISPYAASKLACEALGHTYHHVYGLEIVMLRFFTVYGPRQRPDLAIHKFARLIAAGRPIPVFGDGSTARDYTYIDDILEGVLAASERTRGYEVMNLGESQTVTLARLIELLEAALGKKAIIDRQPLQPGDVPVTYADISKARRLLDYQPRTPIEAGIPKFVEWLVKSEQ